MPILLQTLNNDEPINRKMDGYVGVIFQRGRFLQKFECGAVRHSAAQL